MKKSTCIDVKLKKSDKDKDTTTTTTNKKPIPFIWWMIIAFGILILIVIVILLAIAFAYRVFSKKQIQFAHTPQPPVLSPLPSSLSSSPDLEQQKIIPKKKWTPPKQMLQPPTNEKEKRKIYKILAAEAMQKQGIIPFISEKDTNMLLPLQHKEEEEEENEEVLTPGITESFKKNLYKELGDQAMIMKEKLTPSIHGDRPDKFNQKLNNYVNANKSIPTKNKD